MYRAIVIKNWITKEITLKGWWSLMVRALPMLISENPDFPVLGIEKKTLWTSKEVEIIQFHLEKGFNVEFPETLLFESYFESGTLPRRLKTVFMNFNSEAIKSLKTLIFKFASIG